ncbi:smad nuclear interacting protein 1 [Moniliophthora roreri MCA 2997]|uniref:Smad nuclear interacting protein 1 n=1 Tax=Moniliophthora roreri (strain MCA 2997) TaxID=1381753 RepID=V2XT73_MONRO|nr:smad nuclear interacting protein 1 [Moniliophthora roreri MCA 2997]
MPRASRSPPQRSEISSSRGYDHRREDYSSRRRDYGDDSGKSDSRYDSDRPRNNRNSSYRREDDRYGYREVDRERERRRDRDRYDRQRDRDRRSASPRSSRRPRSTSRSKSPVNKAKPNFGASGLLAAETNTVKSVDGKNSTVLKYNEPPEARKPVLNWRLYVFKGSEQVELLHIHRQSAYLVGRDRLVADIPIEHPSCSKQHAVIQYRHVQEKDDFGGSKVVKPFIIDLESTNGTHVNDEPIPTSRYFELKAGDVIKFGQSTREYVFLHDEAS